MLDLRKYFLRPCRLMLVCVLGTSVVLQSAAYGVRPVVLTDALRRPRSPIVERRYESGDLQKTLLDVYEIDCGDIKLQYDIPSVNLPVWFEQGKLPRICDIPNACSDLDEAQKIFREGFRLGSCIPSSLVDQGIGFNILKKSDSIFQALINFTCAPPEAPGTRARLFVKRWINPDLSNSEESRRKVSMYVGLALGSVIQFLMRNGCSFDIVMDYDFEPDQVMQDLIVAQKWLDEKRNCEWEINEFGEPRQIEFKPTDNGTVLVSCMSIGKKSKCLESGEFPRESVDPLIFRENNIARAFRFSMVA